MVKDKQLKADLLELGREIDQKIVIDKIFKCQFCNIEIKPINQYDQQKKYCSEWCKEQINPPQIKHTCITCGDVVQPFLRNRGKLIGHIASYPKFCDECTPSTQRQKRLLKLKQ